MFHVASLSPRSLNSVDPAPVLSTLLAVIYTLFYNFVVDGGREHILRMSVCMPRGELVMRRGIANNIQLSIENAVVLFFSCRVCAITEVHNE